jgi:hypothetical protein
MKATELEQKFDKGEDIIQHLDLSTSRRINQVQRRVNVDFPSWMIESLDKEAHRLGVTRQSVIKVWVAEKLKTKAA